MSHPILYNFQCRAARAALGWTVAELSRRADVGISTIQRFEHSRWIKPGMRAALRATFEWEGLEFSFGSSNEFDIAGGVSWHKQKKGVVGWPPFWSRLTR